MKDENAKLLLGLGLGAIVGVAVGYLLTGDNRKRLSEDLHEAGNGIRDGVKSAFSNVKSKAERTGAKMAGHVEDMAEKVKDKAEEWAEKASEKASAMADDVSEKANDTRRKMNNQAEMDASAHEQYADDFEEDVNKIKSRMKGDKKSNA